MCPRPGYAGHVEKWRYTMYKRQRRSLASGPYPCPRCGKNALIIKIACQQKTVLAVCACSFKTTLDYISRFEAIDYYNHLIDVKDY